ncbi:MAG: hypothetical protein JST22_18390 [Bacteroidetes bacterium]|nr:hypothetical protein [Bacteroidota bacterium]
MTEPFLAYIRTLYFIGPEVEKRYYRLFGDLEYDLLSLRVECAVMDLRIREVKRRATAAVPIDSNAERRISETSQELNEHLYARLERLQKRTAAAKSFRYDHESEAHGYYLVRDIATAILGLRRQEARVRHLETLDDACQAYRQLDIAELIDLHESVQHLLAQERRTVLSRKEAGEWRRRLSALHRRHPLCRSMILDTPEQIAAHAERLKRSIARWQARLEQRGVVYAAGIRSLRFRN